MKHLKPLGLTGMLIMAATVCVTSASAMSRQEWRNFEPGFMDTDNPKIASGDTIGYVVGRFIRNRPDTLYCVALGCLNYEKPTAGEEIDEFSNHIDTFVLTNEEADIPNLYISGNPYMNNLMVSDLDSDGLDELQVLNTWYTSCWQSISAYDLYSGKWMLLTEPISYYVCNDDEQPERYFPHPNGKGRELLVIEDEWDFDSSDDVKQKRKYKPIQREVITVSQNKYYTLPGGVEKRVPLKLRVYD